MTYIEILVTSLFLMAPAYFANMVPVLFRKINFLNYPVDFGKKFGGKRLFGSHKTWRGMVFGTLGGILLAYLQFLIINNTGFPAKYLILNYSDWIIIGFLLGAGALVGDLIKSCIKRRYGVADGKPFRPWDQLDFVIGGLLFLFIYTIPAGIYIFTIVIVSPILHIITNHTAFYLKIRNEKW